jgi:hypothetical protein
VSNWLGLYHPYDSVSSIPEGRKSFASRAVVREASEDLLLHSFSSGVNRGERKLGQTAAIS